MLQNHESFKTVEFARLETKYVQQLDSYGESVMLSPENLTPLPEMIPAYITSCRFGDLLTVCMLNSKQALLVFKEKLIIYTLGVSGDLCDLLETQKPSMELKLITNEEIANTEEDQATNKSTPEILSQVTIPEYVPEKDERATVNLCHEALDSNVKFYVLNVKDLPSQYSRCDAEYNKINQKVTLKYGGRPFTFSTFKWTKMVEVKMSY